MPLSKRPTSDMTMADGSPLRVPQAGEIDVDGDVMGREYQRPINPVSHLVQSGHGFGIKTFSRDEAKTRRNCVYCGVVLRNRAVDSWHCEFPDAPWAFCECSSCLCRQLDEQGRYRERGRPRVQCGSSECKRQHDRDRKRRSRLFTNGREPSSRQTCRSVTADGSVSVGVRGEAHVAEAPSPPAL